MLCFVDTPRRPDLPPPAPRDRAVWRWLLLGSAAAALLCALQPWIRVRFDRLFGLAFGPPGWHGTAGFTCLGTSALVIVLALAESGSRSAREATRPGSLLLVAITVVVVVVEWRQGPGTLGGVSASWTVPFHLLLLSLPALLTASVVRWRNTVARPR